MTGRWWNHTAEALWNGSTLLVSRWTERITGWCRRAKTPAGRVVRLGVALLLAWIAVRAATRFARGHPWRIAFLAAWWCWAALRAHRGGGRPVAPTAAAAVPEGPDEHRIEVSPEQFLRLAREAIGDARGVHLVSLVERLTEVHPDQPWDIPAVRDLAAAAGVPVRPVVRAPGRGPTVGIHRDDLPASSASPSAPPTAVVGATTPQVSTATTGPTTPPTTAPTTPAAPGAEQGFVVEDDPTNGRRALVKWS